MNFKTLVLLALMGTACSCPMCRHGCHIADRHHQQDLTLVSEFRHSSVAPWNLVQDYVEDRAPQNIMKAECIHCIVTNMTAKPIVIKTTVYERVRFCNNTGKSVWCKCPFELAVGCTCVQKQVVV